LNYNKSKKLLLKIIRTVHDKQINIVGMWSYVVKNCGMILEIEWGKSIVRIQKLGVRKFISLWISVSSLRYSVIQLFHWNAQRRCRVKRS